jgi:hypothetical protein
VRGLVLAWADREGTIRKVKCVGVPPVFVVHEDPGEKGVNMRRDAKNVSHKRYPDRYHLVVLRLCGSNLDPAKITRALGLEPGTAQPSANLKIESRRIYKTKLGHWNLDSRLRRNATLQSHVKDILEQIRPRKKTLRRILKNVDADLNICVEPHRDVAIATYLFSAEVISEFASLGIDIQFSIHVPGKVP